MRSARHVHISVAPPGFTKLWPSSSVLEPALGYPSSQQTPDVMRRGGNDLQSAGLVLTVGGLFELSVERPALGVLNRRRYQGSRAVCLQESQIRNWPVNSLGQTIQTPLVSIANALDHKRGYRRAGCSCTLFNSTPLASTALARLQVVPVKYQHS